MRRSFKPQLEALEGRLAPAQWTVTSVADSGAGTLREVITNNPDLSDGDTILFGAGIAGQTITLTSEISTSVNLTIDGTTRNITLSGNQVTRILHFNGSASETVNNLTLKNGKGDTGAGVYCESGTLRLNNDQFFSNIATGSGGAVFSGGRSDFGDVLTVTNTKFNGNQSTAGYGGGIGTQVTTGLNISLDTCSFTENKALLGGGALYATGSPERTLDVRNCDFTNNQVTGSDVGTYSGGAIYTTDVTTIRAAGDTGTSTFTNNTARDGGGAVYYAPAANADSSLTVRNVTFAGNRAILGGGVYSNVSTNAGAVQVTITGCLFNGNRAEDLSDPPGATAGGGLAANHTTAGTGSTTLTVQNSTFYNNYSGTQGGGLSLNLTADTAGMNSVTLTSLTVTKNFAQQAGGGLYTLYTGPANGNVYPKVRNSIIAGNLITTAASNGFDVKGRVLSLGFNLVGIGEGSENSFGQSDYVGTAANPKDPGLDSNGLTNNGGPTQTIKVLTTSVAYQHGDPNLAGTTDQRGIGYTRRSDDTHKVTIGAYDPDATTP
jgi:predicted outer membrane repeat protein